MSIAERTASERFIQAMGPMVKDASKMNKVILFIQAMRENENELPKMSFQELEECIPLDVAFEEVRQNVSRSFASK